MCHGWLIEMSACWAATGALRHAGLWTKHLGRPCGVSYAPGRKGGVQSPLRGPGISRRAAPTGAGALGRSCCSTGRRSAAGAARTRTAGRARTGCVTGCGLSARRRRRPTLHEGRAGSESVLGGGALRRGLRLAPGWRPRRPPLVEASLAASRRGWRPRRPPLVEASLEDRQRFGRKLHLADTGMERCEQKKRYRAPGGRALQRGRSLRRPAGPGGPGAPGAKEHAVYGPGPGRPGPGRRSPDPAPGSPPALGAPSGRPAPSLPYGCRLKAMFCWFYISS